MSLHISGFELKIMKGSNMGALKRWSAADAEKCVMLVVFF